MKYWKAGIIFLTAFLIQPSLLNMISIGGVTPNLLLCLVVIFSFIYEDKLYGVVYGTAFGILYDVCFGEFIGPTPIALVTVAIGIILARQYANVENILNMWIVSIISFSVYYLLNWALCSIAGNPIGLLYVFGKAARVIPYSMVVITVMYLILIKSNKISQR